MQCIIVQDTEYRRCVLSDQTGGSARGKLIISEEWKCIRVATITLLTLIFSGSAFARIGNSARSDDLESPYAVIDEQISNLRAQGASPWITIAKHPRAYATRSRAIDAIIARLFRGAESNG